MTPLNLILEDRLNKKKFGEEDWLYLRSRKNG